MRSAASEPGPTVAYFWTGGWSDASDSFTR